MLNMISSLASLSQTLRTSHSKPTAADSSTHTPQSSPSASTASISEQGQAMLVQSRMATQQNATAEQARLAEEARAIARKLEFHYTPKHGSWLNIAELELAVLSNMCLSQRIADEETLRREVEANVRERNAKAIPIKWKFSTQDARRKLARLYPRVST